MKKNVLNFTVLIERGEDGIYVAKVPDIAGCYTQGRTISQVLDRIKEAIEVCLEYYYPLNLDSNVNFFKGDFWLN